MNSREFLLAESRLVANLFGKGLVIFILPANIGLFEFSINARKLFVRFFILDMQSPREIRRTNGGPHLDIYTGHVTSVKLSGKKIDTFTE